MVYWLQLRYGVGSRVFGSRVVGGGGVMCLSGGICVVINSKELICTTKYLKL